MNGLGAYGVATPGGVVTYDSKEQADAMNSTVIDFENALKFKKDNNLDLIIVWEDFRDGYGAKVWKLLYQELGLKNELVLAKLQSELNKLTTNTDTVIANVSSDNSKATNTNSNLIPALIGAGLLVLLFKKKS